MLPIHPAALAAAADLGGNPTAQVAAQVTEQVATLVEHLNGDLARGELQDAMGLIHREHFRKAYLLPALAAGLVEFAEGGDVAGGLRDAFAGVSPKIWACGVGSLDGN